MILYYWEIYLQDVNVSICHNFSIFGAFLLKSGELCILKFTMILIPDVDAVGKPRSGYLRGNILWLGSYSECRDISNAQYCTAKLGISVTNIKIPVCYFAYTLHQFFVNKSELDL